MKVKVETIPQTEGIKCALPQIDYSDTFSTTNHQDNLDEILKLVFSTMPKWVSFLMNLRNKIVKIFGLKAGMPKDSNLEVGGNIGFFEIFSIHQQEIILGADDKHLNFRVSVYDSGEKQFNIKLTTLVQYNNRFGKFYMNVIKPFHRLIVKIMIKQAYKSNL